VTSEKYTLANQKRPETRGKEREGTKKENKYKKIKKKVYDQI